MVHLSENINETVIVKNTLENSLELSWRFK